MNDDAVTRQLAHLLCVRIMMEVHAAGRVSRRAPRGGAVTFLPELPDTIEGLLFDTLSLIKAEAGRQTLKQHYPDGRIVMNTKREDPPP